MSTRRSARLSSSAHNSANSSDPVATKDTPTAASTKKSTKGSKVSSNTSIKRKNPKKDANPSKGAVSSPTEAPKPTKKRKTATETPVAEQTESLSSNIKIMAEPVTPAKSNRRVPRRVDPHVTNALLRTPAGSKVAAYAPEPIGKDEDESPSKEKNSATTASNNNESATGPPITTENLLERAEAHLIQIDPTLAPLIRNHHCKVFSPAGLAEEIDPFTSLVSSIMAQQVSGAAASSIKRKFIALFDVPDTETNPRAFPTPAQVVAKDIATLRTAGLSQRKAEYVHGLAEKFNNGELSARMLVHATDEEIIEKLTAVRGLGRWSVEMFSCFSLKRTDVFSTGDLGVQRGMAVYMGKDVAKLKNKGGKWKYMSEQDMITIAEKFSPFRTLFMWYMWRIEEVDINAISGD